MKYPTLKYSGIKNKPWQLATEFKITLSNGDEMRIFKGYWTDFASIPTGLRLLLTGNFRRPSKEFPAFIVHDYLYNFGGYSISKFKQGEYADIKVTRKFADEEMRLQMLNYGASKFKARLFWLAVRVGGLFSWKTL